MPATGKMAAQPQDKIQSSVLAKLVIFALLMAIVPIATYFGSLKYIWKGKSVPAAIAAVIAANSVLAGYVVVAFREDSGDTSAVDKAESSSRKSQ